MSPRAKHLEEMRYALAHGLSLPEARRRLAAQKRRAAEAAIENLRNAPVTPGRERRDGRMAVHTTTGSARTGFEFPGNAPWMMRD